VAGEQSFTLSSVAEDWASSTRGTRRSAQRTASLTAATSRLIHTLWPRRGSSVRISLLRPNVKQVQTRIGYVIGDSPVLSPAISTSITYQRLELVCLLTLAQQAFRCHGDPHLGFHTGWTRTMPPHRNGDALGANAVAAAWSHLNPSMLSVRLY
jgi:hypothetical protein